jgi:hypothetical protein
MALHVFVFGAGGLSPLTLAKLGRLDWFSLRPSSSKGEAIGITDARVHASLGRWQAWPCRADPDLSLPGLSHGPQRQAQYPLVSSENSLAPDCHGAHHALAEELNPSAAERVAGLSTNHHRHLALSGSPCTRTPCTNSAICTSRTCCFDELRTRLRCAKEVLWLWLAIDPCTKIVPVLHLGLRTQHMAHLLIHSLRERLAPGCLPLFTSDRLNLHFYAPFGRL